MSKYVGNIVTAGVPTGYSVSFDGNGDYLTAPNNTAFDFGSGNFTIEMWVNPTSSSATYSSLWGKRSSASVYTPIQIGLVLSGGVYKTYYAGSLNGTTFGINGSFTAGSITVPLNAWTHIAIVRNGTTFTSYVNGVQDFVVTSISGALTTNSDNQAIGASATNGAEAFSGYISNCRAVKGTAVYTANFTPPTQLFAITNTSLLTCQQPTIIDTSSNNFTITVNGNAAVSTLSPYPAYQAYNPALGGATNGIWNLNEAAYAAQNRSWNMYDPYFDYVTLLLNGDNAANGAQNNTFLDSSTNNFTITRNGNTTQGTFSPYGDLWSNYFDGSGDYLTVPSNAAFAPSTGDFTIECWANNTTSDTSQVIFITDATGGIGFGFEGGALVLFRRNAGVDLQYTYTIPVGQWVHYAVTRSGTTARLFINGTQIASGSNSVNYSVTGSNAIGSIPSTSGYEFNGYISNFRFVKGTALYTSNFTPSTAPLTAVSGTSLLTCQSNRFRDNSSNNFAITVNGNTSVQRFSPFNPTAPYSTSTIGGSGYFDGTGDYLSLGGQSAFSFGTGDWTIETWVYFNNVSASSNIYESRATTEANRPTIYVASGTVRFFNGTTDAITSSTVSTGQWYHIAVSKASGSTRMFINGTQSGSTYSDSLNYGIGAGRPLIGAYNLSSGYLNGYLSNLRVVKGTAVYTTGFTPPTAPLTAVSGTSLLTGMTNAGIPDAAMMNDLETVGNAQVSTSVKKYGTGSLAFDGTGDSIFARPTTPVLALGGGDFTIEAWVYPTSLATYDTIYDSRIGDSGTGIAVLLNSSGNVVLYYSAAVQFTSSSTVSANVWTHVAVVRSGTTITVYINGTSAGTKTSVSTNFSDGNAVIGQVNDVATHFYNGYIDDLRITKGYARYTANFTPPTSALQTL